MSYDVIIIGMGPAGLSAGIYTARANLKTLIIGKSVKSRLALTPTRKIENYLGLEKGSGKELLQIGKRQAKRFGAELLEKEVVAVNKDKQFKVGTEDGKKYGAATLILATGALTKESGIENEKRFVGRGVSYCATCDAYFFKDKPVIVVGAQNHAAKEALEVYVHTKNVKIYTNGEEINISPQLLKELKSRNIKISKDKISKIVGKKSTEKIVLEDGKIIPVKGVFIALGIASLTILTAQLGIKTKERFIVVDRNQKTNIKGVFAAGDCTGGVTQLAKAVGEGAVAALNAIAFVRHKELVVQW